MFKDCYNVICYWFYDFLKVCFLKGYPCVFNMLFIFKGYKRLFILFFLNFFFLRNLIFINIISVVFSDMFKFAISKV